MDKIKRRLLAVGCPRSGSRFLAKLLANSGVKCGHEAFRRDGTIGMFFAVEDVWYPGRHWVEDETITSRSCYEFEQVWHYVRDPLKVIPSLCKPYINSGHVWCWSERHTGISCGLFPKELRAMKFWVAWNNLIEANEKIDLRIQMELIDDYWDEMKNRLGIPEDKEIPEAYKRDMGSVGEQHERPVPMTWDEMKSIDASVTEQVQEMAARYGYFK